MKQEAIQLIDECVDQEKLAKGLAKIYIAPAIADLKAKVISKELDLIKGTDIDAMLVLKVIEALEAKLV